MIVASEKAVEKAISSAIELISYLRNIEVKDPKEISNPIMSLCDMIAKEIENGEKFEDVIIEIDKIILVALIARGHNTSKKLAKILGKQENTVRQMLFCRKISLKELKQNFETTL